MVSLDHKLTYQRFAQTSISNPIFFSHWVRGFFVFILLFTIHNLYSQTIWLEDFNGLADGTPVDNGATAWSIDDTYVTGTFSVQNNRLEGNNISSNEEPGVWISEAIDISAYEYVELSVDLSSSGAALSNGDWVWVKYETNLSNGEVAIYNSVNDFGSYTVNAKAITGDYLIIRYYARNDGVLEFYYMDNVHVEEYTPTKLYSKGDGNWHNLSTWTSSSTGVGPDAGVIPDNETEVHIINGDDVTIDAFASALNLYVDNGNALFSGGRQELQIENNGTVEIAPGSSINCSGTLSELIFDNGGAFNLIVDDASVGLNINIIKVINISSLSITGLGKIDIADDLLFLSGDFVTVTNDLKGEINLNAGIGSSHPSIRFNGASKCKLINNGTIINLHALHGIINSGNLNEIINSGSMQFSNLNFSNNSLTFSNYNNVTQSGVIENVGVDGIIYNYAGATWNYSGSSFDPDVQLYCNYDANTFNYSGSVDQTIHNPEDAYWNLGLSGGSNKYTTTHLNINGNLDIAALTTFDINTNNKNLTIGGNWTNLGVFVGSGQEVSFTGNADQTISSTGGEVFRELFIDKSSSKLILNDNVEVNYLLHMASGIIDTDVNELYLDRGHYDAIDYTSGWIIGTLKRQVYNVINENQDYLFPLGNTTANSATLNFASINSNGFISGTFIPADPGGRPISLNDGVTVNNVFNDGYWNFKSEGSFSSLDYTLTLNTNGFSNYSLNSETRIIKRDNGSPWSLSGSHLAANPPYVYRENISSDIESAGTGTDFGIGNIDCNLTFTFQPSDQTTCTNGMAVFIANIFGSASATYQWKKDGVDIPGENVFALFLSNVTADDMGYYSCVITDGCEVESDRALLTITEPHSSFGYKYQKTISIDESKISGTQDLINFPLYVDFVDADLRLKANGGKLENVNAYDFAFIDQQGNKLDYELITHNTSTGEFKAWIRIPSLSATINTEIYLLYGNTAITSSQANASENTWLAGYSGVWHLENASDATSNNNDGTLQGSIATAAGKIGNSYIFDGIDDFIEIPDANSLDITSYTLSAWIQATDFVNWDRIIAKPHSSHSYPWSNYGLLINTGSNFIHSEFSYNNNSEQSAISGTTPLNTGQWYHVAATYDESAFSVYVNGALDYSEARSGVITPNNEPLCIGASKFPTPTIDHYFNGIIDEVRVLNNAKSAAWISAEYQNQNSPSTFYAISAEQQHSFITNETCSTDTATYSIPNIFIGYTWNIGNAGRKVNGIGTNEIKVIWDQPGLIKTIRLSVNNTAGCSDNSEIFTVTVNQSPTATISSPGLTEYCQGVNIPLNGNPIGGLAPLSSLWTGSGAASLNDINIANPVFTNNTFGTYELIYKVTDGNSCAATDTIELVIDDTELPTPSCVGNQAVVADNGVCTYTHSGTAWNATATDNCSVSSIGYVLSGVTTGSGSSLAGVAFNLGVTTVTWTATDGSSNTDICSYTVTVTDNQDPTATCVGNQAVVADNGVCTYTHSGTAWNATATDNCSVSSIGYVLSGVTTGSGSSLAGVAFNLGVTTVTWTATDGSSNTDICSYTVTVTDNQDPTATCVGNQAVVADNGVCTYTHSGTAWNATATDNCSVSSIGYVLSGVTTGSGSSLAGVAFNLGVTTVTWTATDGSSNTDICSYTVTVTDNQDPTATCVGNQAVVADNGVCTYTHSGTAWNATATDNCSVSSIGYVLSGVTTGSGSSLAGVAFNLGVTTVTWTATDGSSNTDICSYTVTVTDDQDPTATCVGNQAVVADNGVCTYTHSGTAWNATATDNCSVSSIGYVLSGVTTGSGSSLAGVAFNLGVTTVTWTATDGSSNTDICSYTVTVTDNQDPTATCVGNQAVVADNGVCTYTHSGTAWNATATDNCSVSSIGYVLSGVTTGSGSSLAGVAFNLGVTTVTWTATDGSSNTDICSYTVTVTDNQDPTATCVGNQAVVADNGVCTYTHSGTAWNATATDNCSVSSIGYVLSGVTTGSGSSLAGVAFNLGVTTVTWTATDGSSNTDICSYTVTVTDNQDPTATCVGNQAVVADNGVCTYTHSGTAWNATATDNCSVSSIGYVLSGVTTGSGSSLAGVAFNLGVTTVTWTATDGSSNTGICSYTVTVTDNQDPTATCVGNQAVVADNGVCTYTHSGTAWNATATDNCSVSSIGYVLSGVTTGSGSSLAGVAFNLGVTTVTWTATDGSSNTDICSYTVTVTDNQDPTATCVGNQAVVADNGVCTYTHSGTAWNATATDNCSVSSIGYVLSGVTTGSGSSLAGVAFNLGVTTVTWTATDGSSNTDICSYTVTVTDNQDPTATCVGNQAVVADNGVCTYTHSGTAWNATATDNCSVSSIGYVLSGVTTGSGSSLAGVAFNLGVTTVTWTATDGSSNTDICSYTVTVTDDQDPTATCVGNQAVVADNGVCTYTHSGTAWNATATDNCSVSSIGYVLSGVTTGSGSSLAGVAFNLGVTTVTWTATDGSSNTDICSYTVTVTDNQDPTATCVGNQAVVADNGVCTYTHSGTAWNATATDNCSVSSIGYVLSGVTTGSGSSLAGVAFNLGVTTVTWTATDGSSNTDICSYTVTVTDDQDPTATCVGNQAVVADNGICTYTHSGTAWNATATDNCSVSSIGYVLSGATTGSGSSLAGVAFNLGVTTVTWTATDGSSNTGICSYTVTVTDDQDPTATCVGNQAVVADNGVCTYTHSGTAWNATATDNCSVSSIGYVLSGVTTGSGSSLAGVAFNLGVTTVTWTATDGSSNTGICSYTVTVTDDQDPTATCVGNQAVVADNGVCTYTHSGTAWNATATDNCSVSSIGYVLSGVTTGSGSSLAGVAFNLGVTTVTWTATDGSSNTDICSYTVTVTEDQDPTATCVGNQAVVADNGVCTYTHSGTAWNATATDNCSVSSIGYVLSGVTTGSGSSLAGVAFNLGVTTVTWTATDGSSNTDICSYTVTVTDDQDPTATCVGNQAVVADNGICTYTHSGTAWNATATDNCSVSSIGYVLSGVTTGSGSSLAGVAFNLGVTTVTWTATDGSSNTDICSYTVTVTDDQDPTATCVGNQAVVADNGVCTYTHSGTAWNATATDNCSVSSIGYVLSGVTTGSGSSLAGVAFNLGVTTVTWTATDGSSNTGICSYTVTVTDDQDPTATCVGNQAVVADNGVCTYTHSGTAWNATATDNCSVSSIGYVLSGVTTGSGSSLAGVAFNLGVTTVTWTATDGSSNTDICSYTVTVTDDQDPTAIAFPTLNLDIDLATGMAIIDTNDINNGSFDNCEIVSQSIDVDTFYCDDIGNTIPVTLTVQDASGNSSTDVTNVTIDDYNTAPAIDIEMTSDTLLCSGEYAYIEFVSNTDSTSYGWEITSHNDITNSGTNDTVDYPANGDYTFKEQFFNSSDTARRVSITFNTTLYKRCHQPQFDTTIYFWVVPGLSVDLSPNFDTICNGDTLGIGITSPNVFANLKFKYKITAENTGSVYIGWSGDTTELKKGHRINDTIVNLTNVAQRIYIEAIPYVSDGADISGCSGTTETIEVWVEPDLTIQLPVKRDTICSNGFTNIELRSNSSTTLPIEFKYVVEVNNPTEVEIHYSGTQNGYLDGEFIQDSIVNLSDTVQQLSYIITPYSVDGNGTERCTGVESDTFKIWIQPIPLIAVTTALDTICNNESVEFNIDSLTKGVIGNWVYDIAISRSDNSITGYTEGTGLSSITFTDVLNNPMDDEQWIDYTFHPYIYNNITGINECDQNIANDTTIRIWINPTPAILVSAIPDTICNNGSIVFSIDSITNKTTGEWVYDLTIATSHIDVTGYSEGTGRKDIDFTDVIVNSTEDLQWIDYTFHPYIGNPRTGTTECNPNTDNDTTIRVWINPTPTIAVTVDLDTICNNSRINFNIDSISSGTSGEWVYNITINRSSTSVTGYTEGTDFKTINFSDSLINTTTDEQWIDYTFHPYILNTSSEITDCDPNTGNDTTIRIWINPTADIAVTSVPDTLCNNGSVVFGVDSITNGTTGEWLYDITVVKSHASVTGYSQGTSRKDIGFTDVIVNPTTDKQWLDYTFHPHINADYSGTSCSTTANDTTIRIWVNPTPDISATVSNDTICNGESILFTLDSLTNGTTSWAYDLTINRSSTSITGYTEGDELTSPTFTNVLINPTLNVHWIDYTFHPIIIDPNTGSTYCDHGAGNDTTIRIWINPTPAIAVTAIPDTICDMGSIAFNVDSLTGGTSGEWMYDLSVSVSNASLSGYTSGNNLKIEDFIDNITNPTRDEQWIDYTFHPKVINSTTGLPYCGGSTGNDTTIRVWINPTPDIALSSTIDTICNNGTAILTIDSLTNGVTGTWVYDLSVTRSGPAVTGYTSGTELTTSSISDVLNNSSSDLQWLDYTFHPYILNPRTGLAECDPNTNNDTTIRIWIYPTPDIKVTAVSDTICNNGSTIFTLDSLSNGIFNWGYDLSISLSVPGLTGYTSGATQTANTFTDNLVNPTNGVQWIDYTFHPIVINPNTGVKACDHGDSNDTTIRVWINPTPDIEVAAVPDSICNEATVDFTITNANSSTTGTWVYDISVNPSVPSITGYTTGTDETSLSFSDVLTNPTANAQWVDYTFHSKILNPRTGLPYCDNGAGNDTTIRIWINPTPDIDVTAIPDTICNSGLVSFAIDSITNGTTGRWAYDITAIPSDLSVTGYTEASDTSIVSFDDVLVNPTNGVQWVDYTFHPKIVNPRNSNAYCDNGISNDTTIRVWINPTPDIEVAAVPDTICNEATVDFTITNANSSITGTWVYDISATPSVPSITGYTTGTDETSLSFSDVLTNPTADAQWVDYTFHSKILNPRTGLPYCDNGTGNDTTIRIWINPTPDINVTAIPDTICNSGLVSFAIDSITNGTTGTWAYDITAIPSDLSVTGYTEASDTSVVSFDDVLVNPTNGVQWVDYTFHPKIVNPRNGNAYCDNGISNDTTIRIWINPTPDIEVAAVPDTICNEGTVDFTITNANSNTTGTWVYDISVNPSVPSITGYTTGTDETSLSFSDVLTNPTADAQWVDYTFHSKILNPRTGLPYCDNGAGNDTTIRIWINPTPDINVTAIPDTICNSGLVSFAIDSITNGTTGTWAYDITAIPSDLSVTGYTEASDTSVVSFDDVLVNPTNGVQWVDYTFHPKIVNPRNGNAYCDNGISNDTTIRIWINPTPDIEVAAVPDTICNEGTVDFTITNANSSTTGTWVYDISVNPSVPSITGYTTGTDETSLSFSDILTNPTNNIQWVDYTFHSKILNPRTGLPYCDNGAGNDTTVRIWINPSPNLQVVANPDTICNEDTVDFTIANLHTTLSGSWVYDVSVTTSNAAVTGYTTGTDQTLLSFSDVLTNPTTDAQWVDYTFHPKFLNPRNGLNYCDNGSGADTIVRIWIEPTATVYFDHDQDTICTNLDFDPITLSSLNNPLFDVRFDYQVIPRNPLDVTVTLNGLNTNRPKETVISDHLVNLSDTIQEVLVVVSPYFTDAYGNPKCPGINDTIVIKLTPTLILQDTARTYPKYNIRCHGDANGAFYMYPTGGVLAFGSIYDRSDLDYSLNGSDSWPYDEYTTNHYRVDSLSAGTYDLGTSDFSGCIASKTETLAQADERLSVQIFEKVPIKCAVDIPQGVVYTQKYGGSYFVSGTDTIGHSVTTWVQYGPTPDFPLYGDTLYGVKPGIFIVNVSDTNGCKADTLTYLFGEDAPAQQEFEAMDYNGFNVSCYGQNDGILSARYTPVSDTLTYRLYLTGADTTLIDSVVAPLAGGILEFDSLTAGGYYLDVTSAKGCTSIDSIRIYEPEFPLAIYDYTLSSPYGNEWNVLCNDSTDGSITIDSIQGGRPWNFSFEWSQDGTVLSTNRDIDNLAKGNYTVVVMDGYCVDTTLIELIAPDSIYVSNRIIDNNLCYADSTGRIELIVSGGEGSTPYTFNWAHMPVPQSSVTDNLTAGTYTVSIFDSIGCEVRDTITLTEPDLLTMNSSLSDYHGYEVSCFDGSDGEITLSSEGGTGAKDYLWVYEGATLPNNARQTSLSPGSYFVTIQDINGCEVYDTITLSSPTRLNIESFVTEDKICSTLGIGEISVSGGVPINDTSYTYLWTNGETGRINKNLDIGVNVVIVTDWNNCQIDTSVTTEYISNIDIHIDTVKAVSCFGGSDGILQIDPNDATLPFTTIKWNGVDGGHEYRNAAANTYIVEIIDSKECFEIDTFVLGQPDLIESVITSYDISCNGFSDGYILLDAKGGNGAYNYTMNNEVLNSDIVENLTEGDYIFRITDRKDCIGDDTVTINQPDELQLIEVREERVYPTCPDSPDGTLVASAIGGNDGYNFKWRNAEEQGNVNSGIKEGLYSVTVTDMNGCTQTDSIYLEAALDACLVIPTAISPNFDQYNEQWDIANPIEENVDVTFIYPEMIVKIYNRWGQLVWESERGYPQANAWKGLDNSGRPLPVDSYHYIIHLNDGSGQSLRGVVTIVK